MCALLMCLVLCGMLNLIRNFSKVYFSCFKLHTFDYVLPPSTVFLKPFLQKLFDGKYSQFNIFTERNSLGIMPIIFFDYLKRIIDPKIYLICFVNKYVQINSVTFTLITIEGFMYMVCLSSTTASDFSS